MFSNLVGILAYGENHIIFKKRSSCKIIEKCWGKACFDTIKIWFIEITHQLEYKFGETPHQLENDYN
jgi:hypothetical protein